MADAKRAYWQIPLDEASSYLTIYNTLFGRYRFIRLLFGLVISQDVLQKHLDSASEGLEGVTNNNNSLYSHYSGKRKKKTRKQV